MTNYNLDYGDPTTPTTETGGFDAVVTSGGGSSGGGGGWTRETLDAAAWEMKVLAEAERYTLGLRARARVSRCSCRVRANE